jgi:hypothetical protein
LDGKAGKPTTTLDATQLNEDKNTKVIWKKIVSPRKEARKEEDKTHF